MTIIQPNKNKFRINLVFTSTILCLALTAVLSIYIYNQNVNLKDLLSNQKKALEDLRVANAELKNNFYQLVDSKNLTALAKKLNFQEVRQPEYFDGERQEQLAKLR